MRLIIKGENIKSQTQFVILDDDPTGCQTAHGIDIYFEWEENVILEALDSGKDFFLLINTRAFPKEKAVEINSKIGKIISKYSKKNNRRIKVISRSDSTLRGHFMPETETLYNECGPYDGLVVCPYFKEGNRLTLNNTHYVKNGEDLIPANETEFANDKAFGFINAHLPSWIEEKSNGKWKKEDVVCVTLKDIQKGVEYVYNKIINISNYTPLVLNATEDKDLEIAIQAIQKAENKGKTFLYRTAASFVKMRLGITDKELFQPEKKNFGLVVAGSYVKKTTSQLNYLMENTEVKPVEINIEAVLSNFETYLKEKQNEIESYFTKKQSVLIFTQRLLYQASAEESLKIGEKVMGFLTSLVNGQAICPEFVVAKGGITSNEIARKGLEVKKAKVMGQVAPGVPIIHLDKDAKVPDIDYVIFPGNVGDEKTLTEVFKKFV